MDDKNKELKFKRDMSKLEMEPIKSEKYVPTLEQDLIKVNGGGVPQPELKTKIYDTTQHFDNPNTLVKGAKQISHNPKEIQQLTKGADFKNKIAQLLESRKLNKLAKGLPMLAAVAAGVGSSLYSGESEASEPVPELTPENTINMDESVYEQIPETVERRKKLLEMMGNRVSN